MSRRDHVFSFTGNKIADAATRLADKLEAELPTGDLDAARAELQTGIGNAIDDAMAQVDYGSLFSDSVSCRCPRCLGVSPSEAASIHIAREAASDLPCVYLNDQLWRRLHAATHELHRAKRKIAELRSAAARYRNQPVFMLEADDVAWFGLDQEEAAA